MALVDKLKQALSIGDQDQQVYQNQCRECGTDFETATQDMSKVECPNCGAKKVVTAPSAR